MKQNFPRSHREGGRERQGQSRRQVPAHRRCIPRFLDPFQADQPGKFPMKIAFSGPRNFGSGSVLQRSPPLDNNPRDSFYVHKKSPALPHSMQNPQEKNQKMAIVQTSFKGSTKGKKGTAKKWIMVQNSVIAGLASVLVSSCKTLCRTNHVMQNSVYDESIQNGLSCCIIKNVSRQHEISFSKDLESW